MTTLHRFVLLLTLLVVASCTGVSSAQQVTRDEALQGPTIRQGDRTIIEPRLMGMHDALNRTDVLTPEIRVNRLSELDYDLVYTFTNNTRRSAPLGRLIVGTITLRENVHYLSVQNGSQLKPTTWDTYSHQAWRYPHDAYSPATAIMDDEYAVGISLLYPVLEYKHDALLRIGNPGGVFKGPKDARGWYIAFDLSNSKGVNQYTTLSHQAILPPGETRTYTIAVRVRKRTNPEDTGKVAPQDWLETLLPYREHFREQFGTISYERTNTPIHAVEAANVAAIKSSNPRGFFGDNTTRPDVAGFGGLANKLARPDGYKRVMLWAPSGVFSANRKLNYPPQFTEGWDEVPLLRTTHTRLREVSESGKELGLWWGRSTEYADHWNPTSLERIRLQNREHLRSISRQLNLAQDAGATIIGLDNFTHAMMPVWDQVRLLRAMQRVYPDLTFVVEPMSCDIIHAMAPGFISAFRSPKDGTERLDFHKLRTPHYLADFLIPGHETWALYRYSEVQRVDRSRITQTRAQEDAEHLAGLGFVPTMLTHFTLRRPNAALAAETWLTTVPEELRETDAPRTEPDKQRARAATRAPTRRTPQ